MLALIIGVVVTVAIATAALPVLRHRARLVERARLPIGVKLRRLQRLTWFGAGTVLLCYLVCGTTAVGARRAEDHANTPERLIAVGVVVVLLVAVILGLVASVGPSLTRVRDAARTRAERRPVHPVH
jgi:hypothetical protein